MHDSTSISEHCCSVVEHLGSGQFGTVNKGVWQSPGGAVEVAVKMLKSGSDETDEVKFLQEAAIMGQFKHPNVIKLHGVVTVGKPVSVAHYTHGVILVLLSMLSIPLYDHRQWWCWSSCRMVI